MNLDDLDRAMKLKAELELWERALVRLDASIFRSADLIVSDVAHGHMGQNGQTKIALDRDVLTPWVTERIDDLRRALRELGVNVA